MLLQAINILFFEIFIMDKSLKQYYVTKYDVKIKSLCIHLTYNKKNIYVDNSAWPS